MSKISSLLNDTSHRPWPLPKGKWQYYQEWKNVLFLHWELPFETIRKCVPEKLDIESLNGKYYVSLVAFTMQNARHRSLPKFNSISNFHEINIRTYVNNGNKRGVYFLNIEVEKFLSALIANNLSGLPYEKSNMNFENNKYISQNSKRNFFINTEFKTGLELTDKTEADKWLTELYCVYFENKKNIYRYEVHHKEWELKSVDLNYLRLNYSIGDINLNYKQPDCLHYSDGVEVVTWNKT